MGRKGQERTAQGRTSQASVELMIIIAIGLIALLAFFSLSQEKLSQTTESIAISQAKAAVDSLARAADEVYSEGVNSTKQVYVTIPEGANLTLSEISGHSIKISVRSAGGYTDVVARTEGTVFGSLPDYPGGYWLTVISHEGAVSIGTSVMQVSPTAVFTEMSQASSERENVTVRNYGEDSMVVTGTLGWSESDVTFENLTVLYFLLASGASKNLTFEINSSFYAVGSFAGYLDLVADNGEELSVPLTVHVYGAGGGSPGASNVSYLAVETFKNSSCDTEKLIFDPPSNTTLYGSGWPVGVSLDLAVYNYSGSSVYSTNPVTNSTGEFSVIWSPAGLAGGQYSLNVSDPASPANSASGYFFTVVSC